MQLELTHKGTCKVLATRGSMALPDSQRNGGKQP
jgi:hypothetical protein